LGGVEPSVEPGPGDFGIADSTFDAASAASEAVRASMPPATVLPDAR
jgi:hypothetical protein